MNQGVHFGELVAEFGEAGVGKFIPLLEELAEVGLLARSGHRILLTDRGRLLSNEVFARFIDAKTESNELCLTVE